MKILVDTNILIDQLRGLPAAILFGKTLPADTAISAVTVSKLFAGIRSAQQRQRVKDLVESYRIIPFDVGAAELAGDYLQKFRKSHSLNISDAAIAATARIHDLNLVTLNLKHFPMFPGLRKPY
ncbi:type II toxin-antitoxin system VapC family toxin [Turneriella parva]|uniref:type II toxin-antitoxin system VapC family toxin n=1 Tax=Turneriella parva TaxID=29510 RepID=UPI0005A50193|nr:type II toxin-antitoxin system VapC family toxin [Turneriella parva]